MLRRTGFCIPLSAIWTRHSYGVGEFLDLLPLLPWLKAQNMEILQLLPLNDTGEENSPYSAVSTCAINPLYLSLHALPEVDRMPKLREALERKPSCSESSVNFVEVRKKKLRWIDEYLAGRSVQLLADPKVQSFLRENSGWLQPYAAFTWQKMHRKNLPFWEWSIDVDQAIALTPDSWHNREGLIQYLCWAQLSEVRETANRLGVTLFGDLPILCNRDSVDVWAHPELFDLSLSAGAPPDGYSPRGQVWGFPLFNWSGHVASGFNWWKQRLKLASQAYHMLRIDHILGFFRIWAVPLGGQALDGFFLPEDEGTWLSQGESILRILQESTSLELVGEDLGVRLDGLSEVMQRLHIPGMAVQRWMRNWEKDLSFIPASEYPSFSLATLSTHDSSLIGQWWQEEPEAAKTFCREMNIPYLAPLSASQRKMLLQWIHGARSQLIVNLLQEYLACFADLVPPDLADRRINIPGTINPQNWTLRLFSSVEQIIQHQGLSQLIQECTMISARTSSD